MTYRSDTDPSFKTCNILKIQDVYEEQSILFLHKYEKIILPTSFQNVLRHNYDIHPYMRTRRSSNIYTDIPKK